jgi:hypothetical protein
MVSPNRASVLVLMAAIVGVTFVGRAAFASEIPYIGVQFYFNQDGAYGTVPTTPLGAGDSAGVVPQTHFNAVVGPNGPYYAQSGSGISLTDAGGNTTPVTLTYSVDSSWENTFGSPTPDTELLTGEFKSNGSDSFTLNGVPTGQYDLIAYILNDNAAQDEANYTVGSSTYYVIDQSNNNYSGYVQASNANPTGTRDTGNYVEFDNVTPVGGVITLTETGGIGNNGGNGNYAVAVNGFQLVAVPEPASFSLIGAGAVGLLARRRRR